MDHSAGSKPSPKTSGRVRARPWILLGVGLGAIIVMLFFVGARLGWFSQGEERSLSVHLTIVPWASSTPIPSATPEPSPIQTQTPIEPTPTLGEGQLSIGNLVEVFGTEGDPLRFRTSANLQSDIIFFGLEHEVFEILDGPIQADGYSWWHLGNPYDPAKKGWAVGLYLKPIDSP